MMEEENQFDTTMDDEKLLEELDQQAKIETSMIEKRLRKKFKEKEQEMKDAGPFCTKCRIF